MEITEEKIRQISDEAWQQLGSKGNPIYAKKSRTGSCKTTDGRINEKNHSYSEVTN